MVGGDEGGVRVAKSPKGDNMGNGDDPDDGTAVRGVVVA